jgi:Uma2 family endonuclease
VPAVEGLALVSVQSPLRLDAYNEPEPDLMLLRPRPDDYRASHPRAADVLFLIEVSESSLAYDRTAKLALYAKFAVAEVWIVDVSGAAIEVYPEPAGDAYAVKRRLTHGSLAPSLAPYDIHTFRRLHPCLMAWNCVRPLSMTMGPGLP